MGLDEVAKALGVTEVEHPSRTRRADTGRLRRAGGDRRYRLSLDFLRLAFAYYDRLDRPRLVQPVLAELAEMFGETAHYGELDGAEVVYLGQSRPRGPRVQMTARIGGRNPAYCTGVGKAMLAHALPDAAAVERFVEQHGPLGQRTPKSLTTAARSDRSCAQRGSAGTRSTVRKATPASPASRSRSRSAPATRAARSASRAREPHAARGADQQGRGDPRRHLPSPRRRRGACGRRSLRARPCSAWAGAGP